MTAQDQQSRAKFEALAESLGYDTTDLGHGFCHADTRKAQKVWQAARALPAPVICYVRPGATLPRRMGWETCAATDAGALAVHADGLAVPEGVEPVAWTVVGGVTNWSRDFSKYKTQHYVRPVFTAAQVLAMGRVPVDSEAIEIAKSVHKKLKALRKKDVPMDAYVLLTDAQYVIERLLKSITHPTGD